MSKLIHYFNWTALLLLAIAILQIYSNGNPILDNVFKYNNISVVSPMQWINLGLGIISLLLFIALPIATDLSFNQLKNGYLALILVNILFIVLHVVGFWSSFKGTPFN